MKKSSKGKDPKVGAPLPNSGMELFLLRSEKNQGWWEEVRKVGRSCWALPVIVKSLGFVISARGRQWKTFKQRRDISFISFNSHSGLSIKSGLGWVRVEADERLLLSVATIALM